MPVSQHNSIDSSDQTSGGEKLQKEPLVSIVVPTYNREGVIARAIQSVLDQTYQNWELLIIDDGSTDTTEQIVASFKDQRIKYHLLSTQGGAPAARNYGISRAQGEFIAFLDSDDEWLPPKLFAQLAVFEANGEELGLVYGGMIKYTRKNVSSRLPQLKGDLYSALLRKNVIVGSTSSVLIKRPAIDRVNGFDERFRSRQDLDLFVRIARHYHIDYADEVLVKKYFEDDDRIGRNPHAIIRGWLRFYLKFENELGRNNQKSQYLVSLGRKFMRYGKLRAGRICLIKAIHERPTEFQAYKLLIQQCIRK
jgi:glycosyltransferase involved in cell wall biosynthesis